MRKKNCHTKQLKKWQVRAFEIQFARAFEIQSEGLIYMHISYVYALQGNQDLYYT